MDMVSSSCKQVVLVSSSGAGSRNLETGADSGAGVKMLCSPPLLKYSIIEGTADRPMLPRDRHESKVHNQGKHDIPYVQQ